MNKYGYIEKRYISVNDLRKVCIREDWFNAGTDEEYSKMFDMAINMDNVTTDGLVELATYIAEHTDFAHIIDDDWFCNILYILAKDACITCFDVSR